MRALQNKLHCPDDDIRDLKPKGKQDFRLLFVFISLFNYKKNNKHVSMECALYFLGGYFELRRQSAEFGCLMHV